MEMPGAPWAELFSLMLSQNLLCCKSWPFLVFSLCASERSLAPSSLGPSFRWQETAIRSLLSFLFFRLNCPNPVILPSCGRPPAFPVALHWARSWLQISLFSRRGSKPYSVCEMQPHNCWVEGNNHFTRHAGCALGNAFSRTASLRHCWGMLLTHIVIHHNSQHSFCIDAIQTFGPQPAQTMELFPPREEPSVLHLSLLNLRRFLSAHPCWGFSERQTCLPTCPPLTLEFLWPENQVFAIWKAGRILKMLNSISPQNQLLASCQLDFNPLTTTPCTPARTPSFSPTLQFTHPLWTSSVWLQWETKSLEIIIWQSLLVRNHKLFLWNGWSFPWTGELNTRQAGKWKYN